MVISNGIACFGTLDKSEFENIKHCDMYKQIMICKKFELPHQKPDIEFIFEELTKCFVTKYDVIDTPFGKKIVFHGNFEVKIVYVAHNPEQSVHSAHYQVNFCDFIHCHHLSHAKSCKFLEVVPYIENIEVCQVSPREFELYILLLVTAQNSCCIVPKY